MSSSLSSTSASMYSLCCLCSPISDSHKITASDLKGQIGGWEEGSHMVDVQQVGERWEGRAFAALSQALAGCDLTGQTIGGEKMIS